MLYVFLANFRLSKDTSDHKFERRIIKQIINLKTNPGILFSEALYSGENQQSQSRVRAESGLTWDHAAFSHAGPSFLSSL